MSAFLHVLPYVGTITVFVVALGSCAWRVSRAMLLHRAGSAALKHGSDDPHGKAGLKIVKALTSDDEPWYLKALPWRGSGDGEP